MSTSRLPEPCPQCDTMLESKDDAIVHMFQHIGEGDIDPFASGGVRGNE